MGYSQELKEAILEKVLAPNNESSLKLARETGVNSSTIRRWKQDALKNRGGIALDKEKFTSHDKFAIVVETASMNELELSTYAREKGLHVQEINQWREACENANDKQPSKSAAEIDRELRKCRAEKKQLEREVLRKDKALAETAALLTLSKKVRAIWGEEDEEE